MARIAYGSLFLNFAPDATDKPTTTEIGNLIINYYQQSYNIFYGPNTYDTTDTATTDPQELIRSSEFEGMLVAELSWKVQQWHDAGISSDGEIIRMPSFKISKELESDLRHMMSRTTDKISSIRVMGSEWDDMGVL